MPIYERRLKGRWRARVRRQGIDRSKTFATKAAARKWAEKLEVEISDGKIRTSTAYTLGDAARLWSENVARYRAGAKWDMVRAERLARDPLASYRLADLDIEKVEAWRDRRLREVKPGSVRREWSTLSAIITYARRMNWISHHPFRGASKPPAPPPRNRRISDDEIERICFALTFDGETVENKMHEVALAFLLAIETGMRLGEICLLRDPSLIDLPARKVHLPKTKNGDPRDVPLSTEAVRLLELLPEGRFTLSSGVGTTYFRTARIRAGIDGLTFHDSRHEACTRLSEKLTVLELARVIGHRDPRSLMTYYNPTATELAAKLD